jgi:hypothetical protein
MLLERVRTETFFNLMGSWRRLLGSGGSREHSGRHRPWLRYIGGKRPPAGARRGSTPPGPKCWLSRHGWRRSQIERFKLDHLED